MNWRKSGLNSGFALIPLQLDFTSSMVTLPEKSVINHSIRGIDKTGYAHTAKILGAV